MRSILGMLALAFVGTAFAAESVQDNCAMCHTDAPVPAEHPPVVAVSAEHCGSCHGGGEDDPYVSAVHGRHLEMGLGCEGCHVGGVPAAPPKAASSER